MPEHNLIQRPDLIHRLQQFFGIRQAHVTPTLAPTVQPVVVVADLAQEMRSQVKVPGLTLGGQITFGRSFSDVAVIGQKSGFLLRNPVGSGRVVRVRAVGFGNNGASAVIFDTAFHPTAADDYPTVLTPALMDTTFVPIATTFPIQIPASVAVCTSGALLAPVAGFTWYEDDFTPPSTFIVADHLPVLNPGWGMQILQTLANLPCAGFVHWTEEPLAQGS